MRKSKSSLKKKAWLIFSKCVRLRDCLRTTDSPEYGECISCTQTFEYRNLDAGHFVPKRNNNYFSRKGVNSQCQKCNRYLHGNQLGYRRGLIELYGEDVVKELELENIPKKNFTIVELETLIKEFNDWYKELNRG